MTGSAQRRMIVADNDIQNPAFLHDVITGLSAAQKSIPARWFYDHRGSQLFEDITRLPEYYPTRVETALLRDHAGDIAAIVGTGSAIVEIGAGSSTKTPILIEALAPRTYVPIDISGEFLRDSSAAVARRFPDLQVIPVEADFMQPIILPQAVGQSRRIGFFPGSTIGNLVPGEAVDLLRSLAQTIGAGGWLLIGMDRRKSVDRLIAAYDDAAGVTAAFNLNLLHRINAELCGTINIDAFDHLAVWNAADSRMEMHLKANRDTQFAVDGRGFALTAGETIHTENSHKYSEDQVRILLSAGGWRIETIWSDADGDFLIALAHVRADAAR